MENLEPKGGNGAENYNLFMVKGGSST